MGRLKPSRHNRTEGGSVRRYAFFDMDETVSPGHSMIDFAAFLVAGDHAPGSLADDVRQLWEDYVAGEIDYATGNDRLVTLLGRSLAGKPVAEVRQWSRAFAAARAGVFAWVEQAFALLRREDFEVWLLSASLSPCVQAIARCVGVTRYRCTRLEVADGRYTGHVARRVPPEQKRRWVEDLRSREPATFALGVGDSIGDIEMLAAVDRAFVINAHEPKLLRLARQQGWCVTSPSTILADLEAALRPVDDGGHCEPAHRKLPLPHVSNS
jgi:HAD superfamily hydrolase (TIGR01490 family)